MRAKTFICLGCLLCTLAITAIQVQAGGSKIRCTPPIDVAMMGFKNQGVWYFLCSAPAFPVRIAPHYFQFGPPPPCTNPMVASRALQMEQGYHNVKIPNNIPPIQPYNANYGPQMMR